MDLRQARGGGSRRFPAPPSCAGGGVCFLLGAFHRALRGELAFLLGDEGLHDDEDAEQGADDDLRPPGGERALEADEGQDDALDQHADEGAGHEGDAACEQRAADDGGGDGVHLHAEAVEVVARQHDEAVRDAAEGGAEAGDGEDEHLRAEDRQAHERGAISLPFRRMVPPSLG